MRNWKERNFRRKTYTKLTETNDIAGRNNQEIVGKNIF